jgi:hypothetical protein
MTYEIIQGSYGVRWSQICTPDKSVWVYNASNKQEWQIQMRLDSTNHHDVPHYIHGTVYKHTIPKLTYSLNIITETKTVEPIQRMYFDTVDEAIDRAQTFIEKVVNGGVQ